MVDYRPMVDNIDPLAALHRRNLVVLFACKVSLLHLLMDNLPGVMRAPVVDEEYLA